MLLAAVQHDIVWQNPAATCSRVDPLVRAAARDGARIVALPEMFATGFSMDSALVAEPPDGPIHGWMGSLAEELGVWIAGTVATRAPDTPLPTNRAWIMGPGGERAFYDKRHPFTHSGEHLAYAAGDRSVVTTVEGVRLAPSVCYDLRFTDCYWPLAPATDAFLVLANWPFSRRAHWRALLIARAIENQAWVIGVNRVGEGGRVEYGGGSLVVAPTGEVVAEADDLEGTLLVDVDPAAVTRWRSEFPALADRGPSSATVPDLARPDPARPDPARPDPADSGSVTVR